MADISNYTDIIKNASPGETVRDAFIEVLRILNKMGGSVSSLGGQPESYYASNDEMVDIIDEFKKAMIWATDAETAKPKEKSEIILTSGQIWEAVNAIDGVLENLNNYERPTRDLVKNIENIEKAKEAILDAIKVKSPGKFTKKSKLNTDDFRLYAEYIKNLPGPGVVTMKELSIDENTIKSHKKNDDGSITITADEEFDDADDDHRYAYNKIVTEVKHNTKTYSTSYNEKLEATEGFVGWSKISVSSSSSVGTGRSGSTSGTNTVDENGLVDRFEATENRLYEASVDGSCQGWRSVYVNVQNPEIDYNKTYTVHFYDADSEGNKGEFITDVTGVPFNGNALCPEELKPQDSPGRYFAGWNPPSSKIRKETDCVAVYNSQAPTLGEIPDSWETIISNRGSIYTPKQYKTLLLTDGSSIRMQKVASGEDVSTSTWIAMDCLQNMHRYRDDIPEAGCIGWSASDLRAWLNGEFFMNSLPELIRDNIVDVEKATYEYNLDYNSKYISLVRDRVWIPSVAEIIGQESEAEYKRFANDQFYSAMAQGEYVGNNGCYDHILRESIGHFYKEVYPETQSIGFSDNYIFRTPSGTDSLIKTMNGTASWWITRTFSATRWGYNSNAICAFNVAVQNNGSIDGTAYAGGYWSDTPVVIGFCL